MHVALVTHNLVRSDGQGRVNLEVAREALRRGHRLLLIATRVDADLAAHPSVAWERVSVAGWPTQLVKNQIFAAKATARLGRHDPDVVLACGFTCWARTDLNVVHFVHRAWWHSPVHTRYTRGGAYGAYQAAYTGLNIALERTVLAKTREVLAVSHLVADQLVGVAPPGVPVHVVLNGVDTEEFVPGCADRTTLGLPTEGPLALFVGDIKTPLKNLDGVLRVLVEVPGLYLAVAGDMAGSPYPSLAEKLGVADRVVFLGFRSDVAVLFQAVDLFVFPSRYETFSLVVLEAMASGVPVVTAATVGAAELVGDDAGIVISDPDDQEGLRDALRALTSDAGLRNQMGAAGRARAESHTFNAMAGQYLDLLEEMAGRKTAGVLT